MHTDLYGFILNFKYKICVSTEKVETYKNSLVAGGGSLYSHYPKVSHLAPETSSRGVFVFAAGAHTTVYLAVDVEGETVGEAAVTTRCEREVS